MLLTIKPNERTLMFRDGAPVELLGPGRHRFWFSERLTFQTYNIDEIVTKWTPELDAVLTDNDAKLVVVRDMEVALVTVDGLADRVLTAGKYVVWTNRRVVVVKIVDVNGIVVEIPEMFVSLMPKPQAKVVEVRDVELALITVDGIADRVLTAGKYVIWQERRTVGVELVNVEGVVLAIYETFWEKLPTEDTMVVEVGDAEVGLVSIDGLAHRVLTAGKYVLWTNRRVVAVKIVDVDGIVVEIPEMFVSLMPKPQAKVVEVRDVEIALITVDGMADRVLTAGKYVIWKERRTVVVEVVNVEGVVLAIYETFWAKLPTEDTMVVEVGDAEVGLVTIDGLAYRVLTAGKYVLWTTRHDVSVDVVNVEDVLLDIPDAFWAKMPTSQTTVLVVRPFERTLVYVDGKLELTLAEGRYLISRFNRSVAFNSADLRERELQVGGQEVMTSDKVSIRINLMMKFRVLDPVKAAESVDDLDAALYAILQIAARNFIAGVTVDGLLESRDALARALFETVSAEAEKWGVETIRADLKDIVLPGDMKMILNQVIAAEKQAQANLIMRREETAATRSLANTAKMFEKNPMLLRLKELEAMQNMVAGVENLTVVAGKDKLLNLLSSD